MALMSVDCVDKVLEELFADNECVNLHFRVRYYSPDKEVSEYVNKNKKCDFSSGKVFFTKFLRNCTFLNNFHGFHPKMTSSLHQQP